MVNITIPNTPNIIKNNIKNNNINNIIKNNNINNNIINNNINNNIKNLYTKPEVNYS